MIDRRRHRKLRLTSRKHFKPKPKQAQTRTVIVDESPCPQEEPEPTSLKISIPVSAYMDLPLIAIDDLHKRLKKLGSIPSGIGKCYG